MVDVTHSIDAYFTLNEIVSLVGKIISSNDVLCTCGRLVGENIHAGSVVFLFFATSEVISHLHRKFTTWITLMINLSCIHMSSS